MHNTFRTLVDITPFPFRIGYNTPIILLGSCFAQNIGGMLQELKYPAISNPLGVVYNPLSVALTLKRIVGSKAITQNELHQHNNLWFSFNHHTELASPSKSECLKQVNEAIAIAHDHWQNTKVLIVTFGTARTYFHNTLNQPVANCHKLPAKYFTHRLLTVDQIVDEWSSTLGLAFKQQPELKVILSVSPIRHWKDGPEGNQVSKATLLLAAARLRELYPMHVFYFPAYEILMDELRDYRFYASDMLHPSQVAVEYIWERFTQAAVNRGEVEITRKVQQINRAISHKPRHATGEAFRQFCRKTLELIASVESDGAKINLAKERQIFEDHLRNSV